MFILSKYVCNQMKLNSLIIPLRRRFSKGSKLLFLNDERPLTFQQHIHLEDGPPDELVYGRPGVRTVCLYTPENKNALSIDLMNRLIFSIKLDDDDPNLRCIVMWAKGNVFSAGHDLKELTKAAGPEKHKQVFETAEKLMKAIVECPVPVIAKVDGHAAAAGCQLVAQCDLVIASTRSKFSTPGANCGIFCSTPGIALARSISRKHALHMLFTGTPITAEEAYRIGLVNKVVPHTKLDDELDKIVSTITSKSRDVITLGKKFFYEQIDKPLLEAYELGSRKMCENLAHPDATEGVDSFINKRKPKWQNELQKTPTDDSDPKPSSSDGAGKTTSIIGNLGNSLKKLKK